MKSGTHSIIKNLSTDFKLDLSCESEIATYLCLARAVYRRFHMKSQVDFLKFLLKKFNKHVITSINKRMYAFDKIVCTQGVRIKHSFCVYTILKYNENR